MSMIWEVIWLSRFWKICIVTIETGCFIKACFSKTICGRGSATLTLLYKNHYVSMATDNWWMICTQECRKEYFSPIHAKFIVLCQIVSKIWIFEKKVWRTCPALPHLPAVTSLSLRYSGCQEMTHGSLWLVTNNTSITVATSRLHKQQLYGKIRWNAGIPLVYNMWVDSSLTFA